jgi:hypothetical protein
VIIAFSPTSLCWSFIELIPKLIIVLFYPFRFPHQNANLLFLLPIVIMFTSADFSVHSTEAAGFALAKGILKTSAKFLFVNKTGAK